MEEEFDPIEKLPQNVRDFFRSNEPRLALEMACLLYNIATEKITEVADFVGDIFYGDSKLDNLPLKISRSLGVSVAVSCGISYEINKNTFFKLIDYFKDAEFLLDQWEKSKVPPIISIEKAERRLLDMEPWIKEEKEKNIKKIEEKRKEIKLSLSDAMVQYPKVGEQSVGSEQIKLRYFPTPVRPSIKNWITDFHDGMGAGKHSPMDRGNFLFHSENGKRLNSADRQKLGIILRSLDEQTLLTIDGDAQVIIFENAEMQSSVISHQSSGGENSITANPISTTSTRSIMPTTNLNSSLHGSRNFGQTQTQRAVRPNVDLRQNKIQQERNTHDVFGDLAPTPKNENIQDKQLNNKVQDFFANVPSSAHDYMGTFSQREKGESKKTSEPDNYFSIPQSKPPIGSEEFHIVNTDNARAESGLKMDQINAVEAPKSGKILDRDSMSDEDLFNMIREKKAKQDAANSNLSVGNFKFSSPQKLPAEQEKQPVQNFVQQPSQQQTVLPKQNNFSIKPSSQIKKSPYHISPSDYEYGKKTEANNEATPKIQKNIVDLKN